MPLALGAVANEALAKRAWIGYEEFIGSQESVVRKKGWKVPSVGEVVGWGFRTLSGYVFGSSSVEGGLGKERRVVILQNLAVATASIQHSMEGVTSRMERVMSLHEFRERFEYCTGTGKKLNDEDIIFLLKYLERDKGLLISVGQTIKFKSGMNAQDDESITEQDSTIANLKSIIRDLTSQITILETKITTLTLSAKTSISQGHKTSALSTLKSRKLAESTLSKRHATLSQLLEVYNSIEQATSQIELVKIMEDSGRVLAGLNKQVGGVERVDAVVDKLREEMDVTAEVGDVIGEVGKASAADELDVDEEFEAMEREEREKREAGERKIREEREKRELEETRRRLADLEEVKKQARESAKVDEADKELSKSMEGMKRMSLEPNPDGTVAR
jgi:charged multivesicular body protein 7